MAALRRLLEELHRRSLWQVLGIYLAAGWIALQVADQLSQQLILPGWIYRGVLVLLICGLFVVLSTAFLQRGLRSRPNPDGRLLQRAFTWRNALLAGAAGFLVLSIVAAVYVSSRALGVGPAATLIGRGVLSERERIIVADFAAPPHDSLLAVAVTEAIRTDLAQSPTLSILDRAAIADALARMRRPAAGAIDGHVAREIAQRDGIKGVIVGAIHRAGPGFVLTAEVLLAPTGEAVAAARESAPDSSEIIAAIDRLSRQLRERIGESLTALRGDEPLDRITTQSLEALQLYARARDAQFLEGDDVRSIALFEEAIRIDSTFAMAYDGLAAAYWNAGLLPPQFQEASRNAYRFRDRAGRRERYLIEGNYQLRFEDDAQKAVAAYRSALGVAPDDREVLFSLGEAHSRLHDYARAEAYYREALLRGSALARLELVESLTHQGRIPEARVALDSAAARVPPNIDIDLRRFYLATLDGRYEAADRHLAEGRHSRPELSWAWEASLNWLALSALARGRIAEAERLWRERIQLGRDAQSDQLRGYTRLAFARSWIAGDVAAGERVLQDGLRARGQTSDSRLAGYYASLGDTARARRALASTPAPYSVNRDPYQLVPEAWIALAGGRTQEAIGLWRAEMESGRCPVCSMWLLGLAYDRASKPDSAIAYYERYLATPWLRKILVDAFAKAYVLERVAQLHDARGNRERASAYYAAVLELWADADPVLQPRVHAARQRLSALRADGPRPPQRD